VCVCVCVPTQQHAVYGDVSLTRDGFLFRKRSATVRTTPRKTSSNRKTGRRPINRFSTGDGRITWSKLAAGVARRRTRQTVRRSSSSSSSVANSTTSPAERRSGPRRKVNVNGILSVVSHAIRPRYNSNDRITKKRQTGWGGGDNARLWAPLTEYKNRPVRISSYRSGTPTFYHFF